MEVSLVNKNRMAVFFLGGMLLLGCAHKHRPLVNPEVEILNTVTLDQVKATTARVLKVIGWKIEEEKPGVTVASITKETLYAKINVEYTVKNITVRYVDSKNLNYKNVSGNGETIHSRYLNWANNVAVYLGRALNTLPAK